MMKKASCTIPIQALQEVGKGVASTMEGNRCQKAGTEDLNSGMLVSGKKKHKMKSRRIH